MSNAADIASGICGGRGVHFIVSVAILRSCSVMMTAV
jgi:hypothetical protein